MNKFIISILAAALMGVPFTTFAMDIISDSELEAVTGQTGVDILVIDINLDLDIMNIAWGDTDCGTLVLSTMRHQYSPGYVNINHIRIDNLYWDLDFDAIGVCTDAAGGSYLSSAAHPITIDVMTFSSNGPHCPDQAYRGKTAVVIGIRDAYLAVENLSLDGIYLDDHAYTPTTVEFTSVQKWMYTTGPLDDSKNLGTLMISGIQVTNHAYVGGYETVNTVPGGELRPINPNHKSLIIISTH